MIHDELKDELKTETYLLYERGVNYNRSVGLYTDTDKNNRMYNGDQWAGCKLGDMDPISLNIIKPIVKQKVGTLNSNLWAINFSADNIDSQEERLLSNRICDALTKRASRVWERDSMDYKVRKITKQSCINSEAILYQRYDEDTKDPTNEIISKNDVCYGNENSSNIQEQPYIIIKTRKPVSQIREIARNNGVSEELLQYIMPDNVTSEEAGEKAKKEVNNMCTILTKMYKKDGTVHFEKSTKSVVIEKDKDSGLRRYPLSHFLWEEVEGYARGEGEVKYIIPNQLEINKTAMRRAIAVKQTAYPQKIINIDDVTNPSEANKIGGIIKVSGKSTDDVKKAFTTTIPANMSSDASLIQSEIMTNTKELAGAGDIATGNFDPSTASGKAILAIQEANQQPLNEQLESLKYFLEDVGRNWLEIWRTYSEDTLNYVDEEEDPSTGEKVEVLKGIEPIALETLQANVKIDITPKGAFDRYAQELSLENLFTSGQITLEEYVDALPNDSVMPKAELEEIVKKRKEAQERIAQVEQRALQLEYQANQLLDEEENVEISTNQENINNEEPINTAI